MITESPQFFYCNYFRIEEIIKTRKVQGYHNQQS
jgi:hypothetical protein